jgi:galactokinase
MDEMPMERTAAGVVGVRFRERFRQKARVFRAPGRVNLIGEHTDYNDGFVMPAAIDCYVWAGVAARAGRRLVVHSENFSESVEFDLEALPPYARHHWSDYVCGVATVLEQSGYRLSGANLSIHGDVPMGSGLSSSAAMEVATGLALLGISGIAPARPDLARICQRAENEFVGARVGIMDPFVSCCGQAGQAVLLDCRSLGFRTVPVPKNVSLAICNTMVKHELAGGEYNTRRAECERGLRLLSRAFPQRPALRDFELAELEAAAGELPEKVYHRCRHVIGENQRTLRAADALEAGDLDLFGWLMRESHRSLRDDYEVSCAELDLMVELAGKVKGVYGARMTGGGFGGCTVNLVASHAVPEFRQTVAAAYGRATGLHPQILVSAAAEGASEVEA